METKNKPVHEIRHGAIKATIWANPTKNGTLYNVTLGRLYKTGSTWKVSHSFDRDDLTTLSQIFGEAGEWILERKKAA